MARRRDRPRATETRETLVLSRNHPGRNVAIGPRPRRTRTSGLGNSRLLVYLGSVRVVAGTDTEGCRMSIEFRPIGHVRTEAEEIPRHWSVSDVEGTLAVEEEYSEGLRDI